MSSPTTERSLRLSIQSIAPMCSGGHHSWQWWMPSSGLFAQSVHSVRSWMCTRRHRQDLLLQYDAGESTC
eukprot:1836568-Prymnesium_polylepis.1